MNNPQRGLGRGLDALFGETPAQGEAAGGSATSLPLDKIIPNPAQPRRHFSKDTLDDLAASIRSQGIMQPLLVRPKPGSPTLYELVAGERRWRAAALAGLKSVPVFVRNFNEHEVMLAALVENLQREDLNPMEEAQALQALRDQGALTQEEIATRLGKSRPAIANALRLLTLSADAQQDLREGRISAGHARSLLSLADADAREILRLAIVERGLSVREAEVAAIAYKEHKAFPWQDAETSSTIPATRAPRSPRSKSAGIKSLQQRLRHRLNLKARVNGSEERGHITLPYETSEELVRLLQHLGLETETPAGGNAVSPLRMVN